MDHILEIPISASMGYTRCLLRTINKLELIFPFLAWIVCSQITVTLVITAALMEKFITMPTILCFEGE